MRLIYLSVILFSFQYFVRAQSASDTLYTDLFGIVNLAQSDAPEALIAKTRFKNQFWRFKSYLADYKPAITLNAVLPDFNRSIDVITLPNGTVAFVKRSQMQNSVGVSLSQDIGLTGGNVFVSTGLQRIDLFQDNNQPAITSYFSNALSIGFTQPIFGFNALKWNRVVEPLRFDEAERLYNEQMEEVSFDAARLFFNVLSAQLNVRASELEKFNADTLFRLSEG